MCTRHLHPGGLQPVQLLEEKILGFALMEIRVRGAWCRLGWYQLCHQTLAASA